MADYAAFLRGINVGRAHRVAGAELCSVFEELGCRDVTTFRASGNVIFGAGAGSAAGIADRLEEGLAKALGYDVAVFLRTASEVRAIAEERPFPRAMVEGSRGKLQVAMLATRPAAGARKRVLALATDEDHLAFGDRELYWLPSAGTQESALDLKAMALGTTTMRTKGTVEQIAAKHFAA